MAGEFNAGSVLVELKAQYQDLKRNVTAAKSEVSGFGSSVDATAKRVSASGQQISQSFDGIDKSSVRLAAKMVRIAGVMLAAQNVFEQFAGSGQKSKGVSAATTGLSTFASIALAFPTPVGVALGAVAGLATGFFSYAKAAGEAAAATEQVLAGIAAFEKKRKDFEVSSRFVGLTQTGTTRDVSLLALQRQQQEDLLRGILSEQATARANHSAALTAGTGVDADFTQSEIDRLEIEVQKARRNLRDLARAEAVKDREALANENKQLLEATGIQLQAGLISPLEAVQIEAQAARKELDALLKDPNKDNTALGLAIDKAKAAQQKVDTERRLGELANNFADAIGRGLSDAILNARSPMEALAGVGRNLFESFINDSIKQFQTGLASAFKALAGGSELAGGALTAALGIGGAVLSRLGNKSSSSFSSVKSAITSSEATRGIIAGPANIAIAAVGENLKRALAGVEARLDIGNEILAAIERNTRGAGGAGGIGGPALAVAVPTDLHG